MQRITQIILATLFCLQTTTQAYAGNLIGTSGDWFRVGISVLASHEAGHASRGRNGTPTGNITFTGGGGIGLNYKIEHPQAPVARFYPGAIVSAKSTYLPKASYNRYLADFSNWKTKALRAEAAVAGAGYDGQQAAIEQFFGDDKRRALILGAALKTGYIAYHFVDTGNIGDIARTAWSVPISLPISALLISSACDLFRASYDTPPTWTIGYFSHASSGAVGLQLSGLF